MKPNYKSIILITVVFVAVLFLILALSGIFDSAAVQIDDSELKAKIDSNEVIAIYVGDDYTAYALYLEDKEDLDDFSSNPKKYASAYAVITSRINLIEYVDNHNSNPASGQEAIKYGLYDPSEGSIWSSILPILLILGVGVIVILFLARSGGGNNKAMNFGKTHARVHTTSKVRFKDVAGAEEEKEELLEIVDFLKDPKKFTSVGARIPKGVLLVGPPGTGKTLFAKAVAGEAGVPFFSISGSDFVEMFVGVGASRVRDLFEQAKKNRPCIVFIDEIDAVGRQRGTGLGGGHDEREQTLNQLLVQMDGFEVNEGVIIMAATNRADILDPALLRPGRFDRQIYVNIPDVKGREEIFKVHSRNKPMSGDINFKNLARITSGFTGADIENLLNEAAILAARSGRTVIVMGDILEGINKVIAGPQKKSRLITESDKRITAYHESGHAIVGKLLKYCNAVQEVSIIPRGQAAGYTLTRPINDDSHVTLNRLNDEITMMLGGRAAEEIIIKDISTGASNDIQRASAIARSMVCEWGMSSLGNIFLGGSHEVFIGKDFQAQHAYSEEMGARIDDEVKKIIDRNYIRALEIIRGNKEIMDKMVRLLYEKETIYGEEVDMLFDGKSVQEILQIMEEEQKKREIKKPNAENNPALDAINEVDAAKKQQEETVAQSLEEQSSKIESKSEEKSVEAPKEEEDKKEPPQVKKATPKPKKPPEEEPKQ